MAYRKIGGQARAMVVTSGIERAIQYYHAFEEYLREQKSPYRSIVAFSGEHDYGGKSVTGKGAAACESLQKEDPANVQYQRDRAVALGTMTRVLLNLGRLPQAEDSARQSVSILEQLAASDPLNASFRGGFKVLLTGPHGLEGWTVSGYSTLLDIDRYGIDDPVGLLGSFDLGRGQRSLHRSEIVNVYTHRDVVATVRAEMIHDVFSPWRERCDSLRVLAPPMGEIFDGMCEYDFRHNTCS